MNIKITKQLKAMEKNIHRHPASKIASNTRTCVLNEEACYRVIISITTDRHNSFLLPSTLRREIFHQTLLSYVSSFLFGRKHVVPGIQELHSDQTIVLLHLTKDRHI